MIATKDGKLNSIASLIPTLFIIFTLLSILISMMWFILECLRSENLSTKWRGRLLLISSSLFLIGSFMDAVLPLNAVTLIIVKTILIIRLLIAYLGWLFPKRVANWLIKENK